MKRAVVAFLAGLGVCELVRRIRNDPWVGSVRSNVDAEALDDAPLDLPDRCREAIEEWNGPLEDAPYVVGRAAPTFEPDGPRW